MDSNIGKKLDGRYELLELIGVGGMADIYKAKDITEDKIVAVKILKTEFNGSEDFLRRFRNESKAIALLSHPNIVKIFDVGFTEKVQFIVMEYIDGITLTEYIERQGVLKWKDAVHFTLQILKALQHAHDRGIVHRDVKSQNVMLLSDGTIKVMDFGIARFNRETDKTISEKAIGSVHYISPEQARGDITDERSDIYSVGVMLYEMLTGKKPFDGETPVAIALMHMQNEAKKMSEINPSIPEGLEEITVKAMQKEPVKRYQTAGEMIKDIEEFKKNPSIVFEYKYFSTDGTTKYFDKVSTGEMDKSTVRKGADLARKERINEDYDDEPEYDDDDYDDYDDDDEVVERRSPLLSILFAVAAVFVIVAAWLIFKIATDNFSSSGISSSVEEMKMPNLINMTWEEAITEYPQLNLQATSEYSSKYEKNVIMDQKVAEGVTIKVTQQVNVVVSLGPKTIEIDDYTTRPKDEVISLLETLGFQKNNNIDILWMEDEEIPYNCVIKTDPPARTTVEYGAKIIVYVSSGPAETMTTVPDFHNLKLATAQANAENYDILLTVKYEASSEVEEGRVISQSIYPMEKVEKNTLVEIVVSNGQSPVRESSIKITLGSSATGEFVFKYYIDGILQEDMTETRDIALSKSIVWAMSGDGTADYAITVTSTVTGATDTLVNMTIDFTTDPPTKTQNEFNANVFKQLLSADPVTTVATEATTPEVTTPEVTEATSEESQTEETSITW